MDDALTAAELDRHRIAETEKDVSELTAVVRSVEREVDRLKIEQAGTSAALARLEGALQERDKQLHGKLDKLHERLDKDVAPVADLAELKAEFTKAREAELREEGAKVMRRRMWQQWRWFTGAAISVGVLAVALLALILG